MSGELREAIAAAVESRSGTCDASGGQAGSCRSKSERGIDTMVNLPGDVWTVLIGIGVFALLPLVLIYIAYRIIR